jgi:hypothetical protein
MPVNGNGIPKCFISTHTIHFARPLKGSIRSNPYDDLTEEFENIFGTIFRNVTRIRYEQTYVFDTISNADFELLVRAKNMNDIVRWMPHSDIDAIKHPCHILDCKEITIDGHEYTKHFYVRVRSVSIMRKYPSPDNQILCRPANVIGFYTYKSTDTGMAEIYENEVVFVVAGHSHGGDPYHYYRCAVLSFLLVGDLDETDFSDTDYWEDLGTL